MDRRATKSTPLSIRLSRESYEAAREIARQTSRPLGSIVSELAEEAIRMRRFPGIVFAGPPGNRRARIAGTGPDIWEVVLTHRSCGENAEQTLQVLEHLSPQHLQIALRYYRACPEEIDRLIAENQRPAEEWERLYPHVTRPWS
jgi:uncharacterized protein (DUF433 family)